MDHGFVQLELGGSFGVLAIIYLLRSSRSQGSSCKARANLIHRELPRSILYHSERAGGQLLVSG